MSRFPTACLLLAILFSINNNTSAQCPAHIPLWDQQRLEDTMALYPNCEHYDGAINIIAGALTDLTPLSSLKSVKGIGLSRDTSLTSLFGLHNITTVTGDVRIGQSPLLTDLDGIAGLTTVSGDFVLSDLANVSSLSAFENLATVGEDFSVWNTASATGSYEFPSLTLVEGNFSVTSNPPGSMVDGFNALERIGGSFGVSALESISGFGALTEIGGNCSPDASSITLNALVTVEGYMSMSNAHVISLENLQRVEGWLTFSEQAQEINGCNNLEYVGQSLNMVRLQMPTYPDFSKLTTVGGDIFLTDNALLESIRGFNALESVEGRFWIASNQEMLSEITGFNNLERVGEFYIRDNEVLTTIEGFQRLKTVTGDLSVWFNDSLTECSSLCPILESADIGGDIHILGNAGPCKWEFTLRDYCDQPFVEMKIADGMPALWQPFLGKEITSITEVPVETIINTTANHKEAIAADGVTEAALIFEFKEEGLADFEIRETSEVLPTSWGNQTVEVDGRYYVLGFYRAPRAFPEESEQDRDPGEISEGFETIDIVFSGDEAEVSETETPVKLLRPPIVLVHGTYSTPEAWEAKSESESMTEALEAEGFSVFAMDYSSSNGSPSILDLSSFENNKLVIWGNDNGIEDALTHYRTELNCAATQADVVGHSLGALLPRIYSSDSYNPDYKRIDNYNEGDINRIISLAGTHFGSHLGEMQFYLDGATVFDVGVLGWLANRAALVVSWMNGAAPSAAVMDQLPLTNPDNMQNALRSIGRTEIPAHAITLSVDRGNLKDPVHDPNEEYYSMFNYLSLLFYYNATMTENYLDEKLKLCDIEGVKSSTTKSGIKPIELYPHLSEEELFKTMFIDAIDLEGKILEIMDGEWELPSNVEIFKYVTAETGMSDWDPLIDIFVGGVDPVDVASGLFWDYITPDPPDRPSAQEDVVEAVRFMIFNNDDNDGTVRVESQSGEIEKECEDCVTHFDNVLHGPAPQYSIVQDRIIELLKDGFEKFNSMGIPPADHVQTLYYPPIEIMPEENSTPDAICQSGMVKSHAEAFARVADLRNAVIIVRPVNPDATTLIERGAATKKMDVKPKSSNWGPQKGYLPVDQRYSKLWEIYEGQKRLDEIAAYNAKSQENIDDGLTVKRHLSIKACNKPFMVMIDTSAYLGELDGNAKDEVVLVPVGDPGMYCLWGETFDEDKPITRCLPVAENNVLLPFYVMATPEVTEEDGTTPRFLTADYDLLMIGFYRGEDLEYDPPGDIPFQEGVGQITQEQIGLISQLNSMVRSRGYRGGDVSHHGPENQFTKSPYIDYPLTAFLPGDPNKFGDGKVRTIYMGDPGFRDFNLKHLINRMRRQGYDLYDNTAAPGWKWTWNEDMDGFELEDSPELNDYVEQLMKRSCDSKTGSTDAFSADCFPPSVRDALYGHAISESAPGAPRLRIWPNPVRASQISLSWQATVETDLNWRIYDGYGQVRMSGRSSIPIGGSMEYIAISELPTGYYRFVADKGVMHTFVIMR